MRLVNLPDFCLDCCQNPSWGLDDPNRLVLTATCGCGTEKFLAVNGKLMTELEHKQYIKMVTSDSIQKLPCGAICF